MVCPTLPPFLNFLLFVPIVGFDCHSLPHLATSRPYLLLTCLFVNLWYLLPLFIKCIGFLLFLPPLSIFLYRSSSSHYVCVVVSVFPVYIGIYTHTLVSKRLSISPYEFLALFKSEFVRYRHFPLSRQSCVALLFYLFNSVP
jgi:hypothetical protein